MICCICDKPVIDFNENYHMIHINTKTCELVVSHNKCFYNKCLLDLEFKKYKKEVEKKLKDQLTVSL